MPQHGVQSVRSAAWQHPLAIALGVFQPITVYPFYDPRPPRIGARPRARRCAESGALWSTFRGVAAKNPNSWLKQRVTPDEITTPTADNRLIAWPYNKLMVANPMVNQGAAALIVTSLAKAREAGVPDDRLVYPSAAHRPKSRAIISCATSSTKATRRMRCSTR